MNIYRAKYYFLRGRALNVTQIYNKETEDLLSKAVKLDPKLVEAWNELGECYWKRDELIESKNCFTRALEYVCIKNIAFCNEFILCNIFRNVIKYR